LLFFDGLVIPWIKSFLGEVKVMPTKITVTIEDELGGSFRRGKRMEETVDLYQLERTGIPSLIYVRGAWIINQ